MNDTATRHVVMLSGGKDSTALALYLRDRHPERRFEYVFCDTHKELPETYEYLARIEACLEQPIERLSSRHGERGFDHYLKLYGGFLPSPRQRWCTRQLKIEPFERHVGNDPTLLYVGLRADERRSGYISTKENIRAVFPFKEDGIDKAAVMRILDESGVGLPSYYEWRSRSGCYFCFFQQKGEWVRLRERHPDLFELAKGYEKVEQATLGRRARAWPISNNPSGATRSCGASVSALNGWPPAGGPATSPRRSDSRSRTMMERMDVWPAICERRSHRTR